MTRVTANACSCALALSGIFRGKLNILPRLAIAMTTPYTYGFHFFGGAMMSLNSLI